MYKLRDEKVLVRGAEPDGRRQMNYSLDNGRPKAGRNEMLVLLEFAVLLSWLAFAALLPGRAPRWRALAKAWDGVARRQALSVVLVGVVAAASAAAVSIGIDWPEPRVHDEFAYLLAADTFALGRLTNPPHPMAAHLETFYVNQSPTYASMYPPGQGVALAIGQSLTGHPIVGVWLSYGLASAAVCWMLQAWLPARWALLGGVLAALRVGFLGSWAGTPGYWSQSYWGGAVAMLGGALVFGSVRRLVPAPSARHAVWLGAGLVILAISRPFEGAVVCIPAAAALAVAVLDRKAVPWATWWRALVLPTALVVAVGAGAWGFYNYRVTGSAWRLPSQVTSTAYAATPYFLWQEPPPLPSYRHDVFREFFVGWGRQTFDERRTLSGYVREWTTRVKDVSSFFLGLMLVVPLVALPLTLRDRWMRFAAVTIAIFLVASWQTAWFQPHYAAPITGLVFALVVQSARYLSCWRWQGRPVGRTLVQTLPIFYVGLVLLSLLFRTPDTADAWHRHRARLLTQLESDGRRHLVIVRYGTGHSPFDEWVFNRADIDAAAVVWARDMGAEANKELLAYFSGRQVWLLEIPEPATPVAITDN
jgi:hypothetical protein